MTNFTEKVSEILRKLKSPKAKLVFLERLLKETKYSNQQEAIKSFIAQVSKQIENEKKDEIERAKAAASEFEKIILGDIKPVTHTPLFEEPEQKAESIEHKLHFVEPEPKMKKSAVESEMGYIEKPNQLSTYLPEPGEKAREGRSYVSSTASFENPDSQKIDEPEWEPKSYTKKDELEGYVRTGEIQDKSAKKEAYKRKKIL